MLKVGLRANNWPAEEETAILVFHIIENYGGHTHEEIKLAFDMAITGKLYEERNGKEQVLDANCYENFSCLYVSRIMNAYRGWAVDVNKQHEKPIHLIEEKRDITYQEMIEWINGLKEWQLPVDLLPISCYDWLIKEKRIRLSVKEEADFLVQAAHHRQSQLIESLNENSSDANKKLEDFNRQLKRGYFEGEEVVNVQNTYKRLVLQSYINS